MSTLMVLTVLSVLAAPPQAGNSTPAYVLNGNDCIISRCPVTLIEEVRVAAQEAGVLAAVTAQEGQLIEQGAELAKIDDKRVRLTRSLAEAEWRVAKKKAESDIEIRFAHKSAEVSKAEHAQADYANSQVRGTVTQVELRRLKLASERAETQVEQAMHEQQIAEVTLAARQLEIEVSELDIQRRSIQSPLSGMVVEVLRHRGEWVNPGDPVARVVRIDRLRVQGFLNVRDFGPEVLDSPVSIEVTMPGGKRETFTGSISFVSPEVEPVSGDFRFWAEIDNRDLLLRPGISADLTIHLTPRRAAVPAAQRPRLSARAE